MPVTLAQAALNAATDLDVSVINEFRTNQILDLMVFDDAVNPVGGGATLTYGYRRQITTSTAAFRAFNSEYTPAEVTTQQFTTNLRPLGGSFQVDRVLAKVGPAASSAIALNLADKIRATKAKFGDTVINGDSTVDTNSFDGLSKALVGSSTESTTLYDLTGTHDQAWGYKVLGMLDDLVALMDRMPTVIMANRRLVNLCRAAARMTSQYQDAANPINGTALAEAFQWGSVIIADAGLKDGSASDVVPINVTDPDSAGPLVAGSTAIYAARIGIDGFHGVSTAGGQLVQTWMPDFAHAGAVKTGEVEMGPVGVALKATKAAAVLRNVKIQ